MKKIVFFFLMTILIASCHQEELSSVPDEPEGKQPVFDLSEEEVLQGCIYVKLKEEPAGEVRVRSIGNTVTTGVKVLDRAASSLKIERMERTFPYAGKFEERTRKEGLHLWYNVWFSKETSATRAATEVAFLDGIETAVPVPKIVSRATPETAWSLYGVRTGEWLFNDPDLSRQWYLDNPGTESWQKKGADIRLFDVWKQYNGNPAVIVAVVDGGINQEHPDCRIIYGRIRMRYQVMVWTMMAMDMWMTYMVIILWMIMRLWFLTAMGLMWRALSVRQIIMEQVSAALQGGTELPAVG